MRDIILEQYKKGKRHFKYLDVEGDFTHYDLSGIIFEECFIASDFKYCNLLNAKFINGNIKTSDFRYANLTHAIFQNLNVEACQFDWAKTEGLIFKNNYCYGKEVDQRDFNILFKSNLSKPKFQIIDGFKLTNRGYVLKGNIIEGIIDKGDQIKINSKLYTISSVEFIYENKHEYSGLIIPLIPEEEINKIQELNKMIIEIIKISRE